MRILIIQPTADKMGHYGIYTTKLCQGLGKAGHAVTLVTNTIRPEIYLKEAPSFRVECSRGNGLAFTRFDRAVQSAPWYHYWGYFRNSFVVTCEGLRRAASGNFDVVYIFDSEFLMASLALKLNSGRLPPVVMYVSAANFSFETYAGSVPKKGYKTFQREVFRRTLGKEIRALSVLGEWHRERLRSQLSLPDSFPIVHIPDGADQPAAAIDSREARAKLGLDYDGSLLLFFGMLRRDKGIETLLEAVSLTRCEECRLLMAGFPMEYSKRDVLALVRKFGIEDRIILRLGYVDDGNVPFHFYAADALVQPYAASYAGGSGPLMKGACTYGRPVIASDVSEMGRLVRHYSFGLVSAPGDPQSLASRIREFLALSPSERERMAENARALGKSNSWERLAEKLERLFEDVVHANGRHVG